MFLTSQGVTGFVFNYLVRQALFIFALGLLILSLQAAAFAQTPAATPPPGTQPPGVEPNPNLPREAQPTQNPSQPPRPGAELRHRSRSTGRSLRRNHPARSGRHL